ncbi:MAG: 16S rRNA (uracil(1498)-N(3))-methyltransferase [Phascolarctobacterium faecium]
MRCKGAGFEGAAADHRPGAVFETELQQARTAGALVVSLGKRILRAETAALVAAAAIFYETGDLEAD